MFSPSTGTWSPGRGRGWWSRWRWWTRFSPRGGSGTLAQRAGGRGRRDEAPGPRAPCPSRRPRGRGGPFPFRGPLSGLPRPGSSGPDGRGCRRTVRGNRGTGRPFAPAAEGPSRGAGGRRPFYLRRGVSGASAQSAGRPVHPRRLGGCGGGRDDRPAPAAGRLLPSAPSLRLPRGGACGVGRVPSGPPAERGLTGATDPDGRDRRRVSQRLDHDDGRSQSPGEDSGGDLLAHGGFKPRHRSEGRNARDLRGRGRRLSVPSLPGDGSVAPGRRGRLPERAAGGEGEDRGVPHRFPARRLRGRGLGPHRVRGAHRAARGEVDRGLRPSSPAAGRLSPRRDVPHRGGRAGPDGGSLRGTPGGGGHRPLRGAFLPLSIAPQRGEAVRDDLLTARDVTFRYGEREVLVGVDLRVGEGKVAVLLGPNGAGKSTLLKIFSGLQRPRAGEVTVLGRPPSSYGRREMARILSVVGQDPPLDFPMSVEEYVMLGRYPHHGFFGQATALDRREVDRAMAMTSLHDLRTRGLGELSAGERQRTAVARAIAQGARVMLLDEPTAFLDIYHRVAFYEVVMRLSESCGVTALIASHDLVLCA